MQSLGLPAPDGGYSWVILLAAFLANLTGISLMRSFGMLFPLIQDYHGTSASQTQWIGGLGSSMFLLVGPVVAGCVLRFGVRTVVISGSLLGSIGFVLSSFANNGHVLILTHSCLTGIGFGAIYSPVLMIIGQYFNKRRALATSIGGAGSGFGAFVMPLFISYINQKFTLQGTFLILGGVILNAAMAGALFTPLHKYWAMQPSRTVCEPSTELSEAQPMLNINKNSDSNEEIKDMEISKTSQTTQLQHPSISTRRASETHLTVGYNENDDSVTRLHASTGALKIRQSSLTNALSYESFAYSHMALSSKQHVVGDSEEGRNDKCACHFLGRRCFKFNAKVTEPALFDFSLLKSKALMIYIVTACLSFISLSIGSSTMIAFALENGISMSKAKIMFSTMSLLNTLVRIVIGWSMDKKWIPVPMFIGFMNLIQGCAMLAEPSCKSDLSMWLFVVVFGCFAGVQMGLNSVALVELMGLEKMPSSFGLVTFFMGTASLYGPYFAGYLRDLTGDWAASFYFGGTCGVLSGSILIIEAIKSKRYQKLVESRRQELSSDSRPTPSTTSSERINTIRST